MRRVRFMHGFTQFGPRGMKETDVSVLTIGEFEAIRLKDLEDLDQVEAAKKMNVSQPTFHRILSSARRKVAEALVNGKMIRIEGGDFKMVRPRMGTGSGRGFGRGAGPSGDCVCPKCGYRAPHQRGIPCYEQKCPKCGAPMTRG